MDPRYHTWMRHARLGMLTPSSNTVLEPVCVAMLAGLPEVSCHFARFRVTEISLEAAALAQFDDERLLEAATLLADAKVDAICWNGTSAGWLGFERDRLLCQRISERTGVPAGSSVLAVDDIFRRTGVRRFGLVSPYLSEVQRRVMASFARQGFDCIAERHLDISENVCFGDVGGDTLKDMIREVARARPDAITIFCTNLRGAPLVEELERELGIPIHDTVAAALWAALRLARVDPSRVRGWGRLFGDAGS